MRFSLAAFLALLALPAWAQTPTGNVDSGRVIARTWCANCHAVDKEPAQRSDAVPSFSAIAAMPSTTALSLQAFLQTPHPRMPNFQLAGQQIDDVVAYILSLKQH